MSASICLGMGVSKQPLVIHASSHTDFVDDLEGVLAHVRLDGDSHTARLGRFSKDCRMPVQWNADYFDVLWLEGVA